MSSRLFWTALVFVCLSVSAHAGLLEICKVSDPPGSLSSYFYYFGISGAGAGLGEIPVFVDSCTPDPIVLPDGPYVITEAPDPTSVLESVFTFPGDPGGALGGPLIAVDLQAETATVQLGGGSDPNDLTDLVTISFTNTPATVPEPGTGWLLGLGLMTVCVLHGNLKKRPYYTALRNATNSVVRRALH